LLCSRHLRIGALCRECLGKTRNRYTIKPATADDRETIRKLVRQFWGEEEQLTFGRLFRVADLPTLIAKNENGVLGFISTADADDSTIIVTLGILPQYQDSGIGTALMNTVEMEAKRKERKRMLVSTSNDDLPALAFYQKRGFQIYEVKPNIIAKKHGKILKGIDGLPVRDELRLRKNFDPL
jgi:ribosomal protein S18 acetylase RimI-like enzyme